MMAHLEGITQIRFKTSMVKSSLCNYNEAYILVNGTITINKGPDNATDANKKTGKRNKEVILKNCAPFVECTREINNTQANHAKALDFVMPMYNLIEYSNNYSKTSGILWKYYRGEPVLNDDDNILDLPGDSASFKLNVKIARKTLLIIIKKMLK